MTTSLKRWLLAPCTSWKALRLCRARNGQLDFDAAWRSVRVRSHPDEIGYQRHGHLIGETRGHGGHGERSALPDRGGPQRSTGRPG